MKSGSASDWSSVVAVGAVVAAVFLGALDQTVIVTVLPAVVTDLEIPFNRIDQAAWIISGYLLGYTVALPLMGRFADVRGRRISFTLALAVFAIGSVGCALSTNLAFLVAARLVQAAGGGALLPVAIAIVSDRYPPARRALAIGAIGAIAEAGGVLGPLYGAAIVSWLDWRWIFWINAPLALLLVVGAYRTLPPDRRPPGRIDLPGAALIAVALAGLIAGLSHEEITLAGRDVRIALVVVGIMAAFGFAVWETRAVEPLLDLHLFRRPAFAAAIVGGILLGGALIVAMVDVPLYAATVLAASPSDGGLLLMRLTAFIPVGALVGGYLGLRLNLAAPTGLGFAAAAAGLGTMSTWGTAPEQNLLWVSLGLAGLGFGLLIAPLSTAAVNAAGSLHEASAAAVFTVGRLTGMTLGLSILTAWGLQRFEDMAGSIPLPLPQPGEAAAAAAQRLADYNQAVLHVGAELYHELFLAAAIVCVVGLGVVGFLRVKGTNRSASAPP